MFYTGWRPLSDVRDFPDAGSREKVRGRFHKPIYALRQVFTLWAKLLGLTKTSQKLGAERKSLV